MSRMSLASRDIISAPLSAKNLDRSHPKKVFWHNLVVGRGIQILEIHEYSSGLNVAPALTLNQNPFLEIASNRLPGSALLPKRAAQMLGKTFDGF